MGTVLIREPPKTIMIDDEETTELSPYLFGHNLEHTRAAVGGGLSAQMLRNRKFCGKPSPYGIAAEWEGLGERAFFRPGSENPESGERYTRHIGCETMYRRNELTSLSVQNLRGGACGLRQTGLRIEGGRAYELRIAAKSVLPVRLTAALTDRRGGRVYAGTSFDLIPGDWRVLHAVLTPSTDDDEAGIGFTFTEKTRVLFGAVSLMPADHFHGMRRDVVECLKQIAPTVIRWPGGNFAGEYRWMDGLLPADRRGPLQSCTEIETQPYSHGYDNHEINTDDFIALCREVGAEPFLTINPVWCTPEESARWVEYCNGDTDTAYGARRAENDSTAPYRVRFWSLGNEMGYGHMEGPHTPEDYAKLARRHADAMLAADPTIELFSSGPYPNDGWAERSAAALFPKAKYVSLHHYSDALLNYTEDSIEETYCAVVNSVRGHAEKIVRMRESLDRFSPGSLISFDEWNFWYAWYRPSCVAEGIFAAKMIHMLMQYSDRYGVPFAAFFQPVNEGAIDVTPAGARLTAVGQIFAAAGGHHGGRRCRVDGAYAFTAAATVKDAAVYVTVVNDSFDRAWDFVIAGPKGEAEGVVYTSEEVSPHTFFEEKPLAIISDETGYTVSLPPHSVAALFVNYGFNASFHRKIVNRHAVPALTMCITMMGAAVLMGILTSSIGADGNVLPSSMIELPTGAVPSVMRCLAGLISAALPAALGKHLLLLLCVLAVPLALSFDTDSYFYGMLPVMLGVGQSFGLQVLPIAITMLILRISATFICPMTAAVLLGTGMAEVTIRKHIKASSLYVWCFSLLCLLFAVFISAYCCLFGLKSSVVSIYH